MLANVVFRKEDNTGEIKIDLSYKTNGIYFVKVISADNKIFKKKLSFY